MFIYMQVHSAYMYVYESFTSFLSLAIITGASSMLYSLTTSVSSCSTSSSIESLTILMDTLLRL